MVLPTYGVVFLQLYAQMCDGCLQQQFCQPTSTLGNVHCRILCVEQLHSLYARFMIWLSGDIPLNPGPFLIISSNVSSMQRYFGAHKLDAPTCGSNKPSPIVNVRSRLSRAVLCEFLAHDAYLQHPYPVCSGCFSTQVSSIKRAFLMGPTRIPSFRHRISIPKLKHVKQLLAQAHLLGLPESIPTCIHPKKLSISSCPCDGL